MADTDDDWLLFDFRGTGTWPDAWPPVAYRLVDDKRAVFRLIPEAAQGNLMGFVHGGFLATLMEHTLFLPIVHRGNPAVTLSLSLDYSAPAQVGEQLDGEIVVMRETGKLVFVTARLDQNGETVVYGTGVVRKLPAP